MILSFSHDPVASSAAARPASQAQRERDADASLVVRFCGDSGDGVQLAGNRFTVDAVQAGLGVSTFPEFPAEIRAPAGSLAGVSAFQVRLGDGVVRTAGDEADVLVALNPAALATNLEALKPAGLLLVDRGAFSERALAQAGYAKDPLPALSAGAQRVVDVDITAAVVGVLAEHGFRRRDALKARNFLALGLVYALFERDDTAMLAWIEQRFAGDDEVRLANATAFRAGVTAAEAMELHSLADTRVQPPLDGEEATLAADRTITGNEATCLGLMTAAALADLELFAGCYPITPASDILHRLSRESGRGVVAMQAEDEIAAIGAAIGASFAGALGVTATSGPGMALKSESLGLAVALEIPLVVIDVQRAGPSTGMPTRVEQGDADLALSGRSGEAPLPVVAARSPADCFHAAVEAVRIAVEHMTPVVLLTDAALANSAEPWQLPDLSVMAPIHPPRALAGDAYRPYARDRRGVRRWAVPGTAGLAHRVGGLEKAADSGEISYDGDNHEAMTVAREDKVARVAERLVDAMELHGDDHGRLLLISWGSTFGAVREAVSEARRLGRSVSHLHLRWLHPLDPRIGDIARRFEQVVVAELNRGQVTRRIRERFLVDARAWSRMRGRPLSRRDLTDAIAEILEP